MLREIIIKKIANTPEQAIKFSNFMNLALYYPQLGYYMRDRDNKNNINNNRVSEDFITAPELSPWLAYSLVQQFLKIFKYINNNKKTILEIGAGSGVLADQILRILSALNQLPDIYYILEISPSLKQQQYKLLQKNFSDLINNNKIIWLDDFAKISKTYKNLINGVIFANECLDALPIERFRIINQFFEQLYIKFDSNQNKFYEHYQQPELNLLRTLNKIFNIQNYPDCYYSEINLNLKKFLKKISEMLNQGAVFFIDYGYSQRDYYHPERSMGTLNCSYKNNNINHKIHDNIFENIGSQDISAHVDFTYLANCGRAACLKLAGFTTQAEFLINNIPSDNSFSRFINLNNNLNKLILPSEMGTLCKIIAFTKNMFNNKLFYNYDHCYLL